MDSGRVSRRDHDHRLVPSEHLRLQGEPGVGESAQGARIGGSEDVRPRPVLDLRAKLLRPGEVEGEGGPGVLLLEASSQVLERVPQRRGGEHRQLCGRQQCAAGFHGQDVA